MTVTLDRIEDGFAIFTGDNGQTYNLPLDILNPDISEGDIFNAEIKDNILAIGDMNEEEKNKRKDRINDLFDRLKRR